jgi:hypothetical protein
MVTKHLLLSDHSEKEMRQTNVYLYRLYYRPFKHVLISLSSLICTEVNLNVIKYFPPY